MQGLLCKRKPSAEFTKGGQRPTPIPTDKGLGYQRLDLSSQVQRFHNIAGTALGWFADAIRRFGPTWAGVCCACGQTGDETLLITQRSKQRYRALVMFYCLNCIPVYAVGHAQKVKCFGHALGVMERFKDSKRFLMCLQTLCGSPYIDQPVPDTIEAASMEFRIGQHLGAIKRLPEPVSRLRVIAPCPQAAEVQQALPFPGAVLCLLCNREGMFVIAVCLLKRADRLIGLSPGPYHCCGWSAAQALERRQCSRKVLNSRAGRVQDQRPFSGALSILRSL